ncbi:hypothetical Protein YC6258_00630 [Gynuella sunshinyii YC6258]|uniref:Uncharacterized protein n=1 Tax=Gynuella sunshinyii YC6258 TaxID=1445510 RepID=A0A0C5VEQ6_9GAMM|nr:hypothetical Protein YC6258_00630 [Gynuella sunshinyii YC6258]
MPRSIPQIMFSVVIRLSHVKSCPVSTTIATAAVKYALRAD